MKKILVILISLFTIAVPAIFGQSNNLVRINGGTFMMGSPANEQIRNQDENQHRVTLDSFYIGKYTVTQVEYESIMGTNPSLFKGLKLPVENVSWYNAIEYCNKLSEKEGLTPVYTIDKSRSDTNNHSEYDNVRWLVTWNRNANGYRLPTEAEWEYACRAGTITRFTTGDMISDVLANYDGRFIYSGYENPNGLFRGKTTDVGSFAPNPWGLYDMYGNVEEWCWDWYGQYPNLAESNPIGAFSGMYRVTRGGSFSHPMSGIRSSARFCASPFGWGDEAVFVGFRVVRNAN